MAKVYVQPTLQEFETVLEGFVQIKLPRTKEIVLAKRVVTWNGMPLSLRVFTSLDPNGLGRDCGKDAIRVQVVIRLQDGTIKRVGGSKRVNRVEGWQKRLMTRVDGWQSQLGPCCPICGMPMVKRKGPSGLRDIYDGTSRDFLGCCTFPRCKGTKKI